MDVVLHIETVINLLYTIVETDNVLSIILFGLLFLIMYKDKSNRLRWMEYTKDFMEMFESRLIPIKQNLKNNFRNDIVKTKPNEIHMDNVLLNKVHFPLILEFNIFIYNLILDQAFERGMVVMRRIAKENHIPKVGTVEFNNYVREKYNEYIAEVSTSLCNSWNNKIFINNLSERIELINIYKDKYYDDFFNTFVQIKQISDKKRSFLNLFKK